METRAVRLPDDTIERMQQLAAKQGCSISDIIRRALDLYLDRSSDEFVKFVNQATIFFDQQNTTTNPGLGDK